MQFFSFSIYVYCLCLMDALMAIKFYLLTYLLTSHRCSSHFHGQTLPRLRSRDIDCLRAETSSDTWYIERTRCSGSLTPTPRHIHVTFHHDLIQLFPHHIAQHVTNNE